MANERVVVSFNSEQDLALLNEDNAIGILVNGEERFLAKDWIIESGRGADSILSKQVLGTKEGLTACTEFELETSLAGVFDMLQLWLALGPVYLQDSLTEENASALFALASYFDLDKLQKAIKTEQEKRVELARKEEQERRDALERLRQHREEENRRRLAQRALFRCRTRCVSCGDPCTTAPTYRGTSPRCFDCREEDYDYSYDEQRDFYDDDYEHDYFDYSS